MHIDNRNANKEMWQEVSKLTKPKTETLFSSSFTAEALNNHCASISHGPSYKTPLLKLLQLVLLKLLVNVKFSLYWIN